MKRMIFLCSETFPPVYQSIKYIFNEYLSRQWQIFWIMPAEEGLLNKAEMQKWGNNSCWFIPKVRAKSIINLVYEYLRYARMIKNKMETILKYTGGAELIIVRDDPFMAWRAYSVCKKRNIPFVYQLSHFKEEEIIYYAKKGIYKNKISNLVKGYLGRIFRNYLLKKADLILAISRQMKLTLVQDNKIEEKKIEVLPEGVEVGLWENQGTTSESELLKSQLKLSSKRVLLYIGTLSRARELDFIIRVLKRLKKEIDNIHLIIIGGGLNDNDEKYLKRVADDMGLGPAVTFMGRLPYSEVLKYMEIAEVGLSPFPDNPIFRNNSPIKTMEYIMAGIPVVASDLPEHRLLLKQGGGLCVKHDEKSYAEAITTLLNNPELRARLVNEGKYYLKKERGFKVLSDKIGKIFENMIYRNKMK